jgi:hypothetical protein
MKNSKLLLTSALVGTVAMGAVANAETKISGSATYTYSFISGTSTVGASPKAGNDQGAGKEVQLDISNSATLENGLGFSAGFSAEMDGNDSAFDGSEGNFMKFSAGNTSFMWNVDKAANLSTTATPKASTSFNTMAAGTGTNAFDYSPGGQAQQSAWNLEIAQKFDGGSVALVYTPRVGDKGGANDNVDTTDVKQGTATDIIFKGNAGVDGLSLVAALSSTDAPSSAQQDQEVQMLGVAYNFGKIAVGYTRSTIDQNDNTDDTQAEYGITYAVADNFTVGIAQTNTDNNGTENEKMTALQAGYNLGAVSIEAYYLDIQNQNGVATAAGVDKVGIRMGTKF